MREYAETGAKPNVHLKQQSEIRSPHCGSKRVFTAVPYRTTTLSSPKEPFNDQFLKEPFFLSSEELFNNLKNEGSLWNINASKEEPLFLRVYHLRSMTEVNTIWFNAVIERIGSLHDN